MIDYLKSLLPRLQSYSRKLDDLSSFTNIPWAVVTEEGTQVTYLFQTNKEFLVSVGGEVTMGTWDYKEVLKSLLIDFNGKKKLYNHGFIDDTVMLLRKDGTDDLFMLANKDLLPSLDIVGHLQEKQAKIELAKNPIPYVHEFLEDGRELSILKANKNDVSFREGSKVYVKETNEFLEDGEYVLKGSPNVIKVRNGEVIEPLLSNSEKICAIIALITACLVIWKASVGG